MNAEIMNEILTDLNRKLSKEERHILLLLDNATSHDPALRDRFSNIRVLFLPKNTTSRLLPLDAGIIKKFQSSLSLSTPAAHIVTNCGRVGFAHPMGTPLSQILDPPLVQTL